MQVILFCILVWIWWGWICSIRSRPEEIGLRMDVWGELESFHALDPLPRLSLSDGLDHCVWHVWAADSHSFTRVTHRRGNLSLFFLPYKRRSKGKYKERKSNMSIPLERSLHIWRVQHDFFLNYTALELLLYVCWLQNWINTTMHLH